MNKHITENLKYYLTLNKSEHAILLTGKWGSGKTFYINDFIKENTKDKVEFIKISLFGLTKLSSINNKIIFKLLSIKEKGFFGDVANIGVKVLDSFGKKLNLSIQDVPIEQIINKLDKEFIFIFDDLERANIPISEILGYINYFIEQSNFKVIIIVNENEITDNEKFIKFKEKVIGKTFEVRHNFNNVLNSFLKEEKYNLLNENKEIIIDIYNKANYKNLRHIKQTILDFEYIIKLIDNEYIKNKEFVSTLIYHFFALNIEIKEGKLKEDELQKHNIYSNYLNEHTKTEDNEVAIIFKKYNIPLLFNSDTWINILFKSNITKDKINQEINNLSFFLEKQKSERTSWVKLWNYRELEEKEFKESLDDVIENFNSCKYEKQTLFLHVIALLVYFSKNKLCSLSLDNIKEQIIKCLKHYKENEYWKNNLLNSNMDFNGTGLGYMNSNDSDFMSLFTLISKENKIIYNDQIKIQNDTKLETFLESIKNGNKNFIIEFLLNEFESEPVLKDLSPNLFFNALIDKNNNIGQTGEVLSSRYGDNKTLNGRPFYSYLVDELEFWNNINTILEQYLDKHSNGLKIHLLKQFKTYIIDDIIQKLTTPISNA